MKIPRFSCDFETNNYPDCCHVWSWGCDNIFTGEYRDGENLESFICFIKGLKRAILYFHNLKFDGSFIVNWLLRNGYKHYIKSDIRDSVPVNYFATLISDMGQWYVVEINFAGNIIKIIDSSKILASSLDNVAKSFGMEIAKGSIDYDLYRPIGYKPTPLEKVYQKTDCKIMSIALKFLLEGGRTGITAGSNALRDYKDRIKHFEKWYPQLDAIVDAFIRTAYRGGWVYVNPAFKDKIIGEGIVLDVNSLYPFAAYTYLLPYGNPIYYDGEYKKDKAYPLYVQRLECCFELKPGKLPTIQIKKSSRFIDTEYVSSSGGEVVELTLSSYDLELFLKHYNVTRKRFICGYKFRGAKGMFNDYIDYWVGQKIDADIKGDKAKRTLSKLMLNSLIGKFGKRPTGRSKIPYLDDDVLKFELGDEEDQGSLYIPIACFVLAAARCYTISYAQKNIKRFCYADTDSLHLKGKTIPKNIPVDKTKLGYFKLEGTFNKARYVGAKCYIENIYNEEKNDYLPSITCAGLPHKLHDGIKFEDFKVGLKVDGKLMPRQVKYGVVLKKSTFELKERKF